MHFLKNLTVSLRGLLVLTIFGLAGCANQNAVYRTRTISGDRPIVFTMDAKQRNVLMLPDARRTATGERSNSGLGWKICAEASPDVFSALSTSAGAELGFGKSGAKTEGQVRAAIAIAEAAGTVERTQTINLLRESMYRTCERYLSGAIDEATFVVQAGRDWRAMISVLAIEQLTRAARPPSTVIVAGGTSTSMARPSELPAKLEAAKSEQRSAEDAAAALALEAAADCTKVDPAKKSDCEAAKAAAPGKKTASDLRVVRAKEDVEDLRDALKAGAQSSEMTASTTGGTSQAGGANTSAAPADLAVVAGVVREITLRALDTNEMQLFCIQQLAKDVPLDVESPLGKQCMSLLTAAVGAEEADVRAVSAGFVAFNAAQRADAAALRSFLVDDAGAVVRWPMLVETSGVLTTNPQLRIPLLTPPVTLDTALFRYLHTLPADYRSRFIEIAKGQK